MIRDDTQEFLKADTESTTEKQNRLKQGNKDFTTEFESYFKEKMHPPEKERSLTKAKCKQSNDNNEAAMHSFSLR